MRKSAAIAAVIVCAAVAVPSASAATADEDHGYTTQTVQYQQNPDRDSFSWRMQQSACSVALHHGGAEVTPAFFAACPDVVADYYRMQGARSAG